MRSVWICAMMMQVILVKMFGGFIIDLLFIICMHAYMQLLPLFKFSLAAVGVRFLYGFWATSFRLQN